ncbi:MAG: hypothetical protein QM779_13805 [Propionicimonas sp.]|uniref:hypothetical protein n=1 Tax=Propionicimonas sp. TaxID=1955623 RepID=UPI003D1525C6
MTRAMERSPGDNYTATEIIYLSQIRDLLDAVPELHRVRESHVRVRPKPTSQIGVDDAATNPTELSHMVTYCQNVAIDNLRSLELLLRAKPPGIFLPQYGAYPLIRAVIESSAQAVWMLRPNESRERIARTLRARRGEVKHELGLRQLMNAPDDSDSPQVRKAKATARQDAAIAAKWWDKTVARLAGEAGITAAATSEGTPGYGPLLEDASIALGVPGAYSRSIWHMVSGLSHPSSTRGLAFSRVEELPGTTSRLKVTRMTADPRVVQSALSLGVAFYQAAEDLLVTRLLTPATR